MWNMEMPSYGWDHINNNSQSLTFRETSSSEYWMSSVHTSSIMGNFSLNTDSSITSLHITFSYCGRLSAATTLALLLQRACTFSLFAFSLMAELLQYLHWLKLSTKHLRVIFSISKEIWEDTHNNISWRQQWMQKIDQYVNWYKSYKRIWRAICILPLFLIMSSKSMSSSCSLSETGTKHQWTNIHCAN